MDKLGESCGIAISAIEFLSSPPMADVLTNGSITFKACGCVHLILCKCDSHPLGTSSLELANAKEDSGSLSKSASQREYLRLIEEQLSSGDSTDDFKSLHVPFTGSADTSSIRNND